MIKRFSNDELLDLIRRDELDFIPNNPYLFKAAQFEDLICSINEIVKLSDELFSSKRRIILEIGSYTGKTLTELARINPNIFFLGNDIVFKRLVKTVEKIKKEKISNVKTIYGDGGNLLRNLKDKSLSCVYVFFPDPWETNEKKRLINKDFIKSLRIKLIDDGFFWFKTDSEGYFNVVSGLIEKDFKIICEIPKFFNREGDKSNFETLFINQSKKIYEIIAVLDA